MIFRKRSSYSGIWPIDPNTANLPPRWQGWPDHKKFALVLTHDVETDKGHQRCLELAAFEKSLGFRSSFNFVPERYAVSAELRRLLSDGGFEVGVHGLFHDGKLYKSREVFRERSIKINHYLNSWNAVGFRSPSMQRNLKWIFDLDILYDASTFDTDPFEPQNDGVATIFPFRVEDKFTQREYVELPYTLPQDFTIFVLMQEKNIDIWKEKLDWIAKIGGMALVNTHPDYMNFSRTKIGVDEYPASYYEHFLNYVQDSYRDQYWHILPKEIAMFWSNNVDCYRA